MQAEPSNQASYEALYRIAARQAGYFTAPQARESGYSQRRLTYYVQTARFRRVKPGIYRLAQFPASPHEDLFVAWLEAGANSVVSHESALALYDLSDNLPAEVHLTIPRTSSRRHPGLRLHTNRLPENETTWYQGLPVTTVARTIADVAAGGLAEELVTQAIREAIRRGLATQQELLRTARQRGGRVRELSERTLQEITT